MNTENLNLPPHIQAAIDAARQQQQAAATEVITPSDSTAVAAPAQAMPVGKRITLEDLATGTMAVDAFLKITHYGFTLGQVDKPFETPLKVKINMVENSGYTPNQTIKFGQNPVTYVKTYDEARTADGKSWPAELDRIRRIDPKASPYPAVDLVMTLLQDHNELKAGQTIGYTTATTSFKHFLAFAKKVAEAGLSGYEVEAVLKCLPRAKNGNKWGELEITLVGPADSE